MNIIKEFRLSTPGNAKSLYFEYRKEEADLQVKRALGELSIEVINSEPFDSCGRGKIERAIGNVKGFYATFRKGYKVDTLEDANRVLDRVIRYYNYVHMNRGIKCTPYERLKGEKGYFRKVLSRKELTRIFSLRDNTIRFKGKVYQLESKRFISCAGKRVKLRYFPGRFLRVYEGSD